MEADYKSIDLFTTRVRQMILQYNELKQRNAALDAKVAEQNGRIGQLEEQLVQLRASYDNLKVARFGAEAPCQADTRCRQVHHARQRGAGVSRAACGRKE